MKKRSITLPMLLFIAVLCFAVLSFPTTASGTSEGPDAIVGARYSLTPLSGASSYDIVVSANRGGTVSASFSDCAGGKTVSFTVTPDGGYETASIAVISASGKDLQVLPSGEGYSFVMPDEAVVIDASFQFARIS